MTDVLQSARVSQAAAGPDADADPVPVSSPEPLADASAEPAPETGAVEDLLMGLSTALQNLLDNLLGGGSGGGGGSSGAVGELLMELSTALQKLLKALLGGTGGGDTGNGGDGSTGQCCCDTCLKECLEPIVETCRPYLPFFEPIYRTYFEPFIIRGNPYYG